MEAEAVALAIIPVAAFECHRFLTTLRSPHDKLPLFAWVPASTRHASLT
jgi:hypothetical protein